ncbi:MAG TPA: UDP-N-acetylmuramyl-tripeptide synthetase [Acidimicrobiales bacterium]|nr:UDP-N-acetylmuramyl-tripeptide synthetase [Acidimicrobiales bacterium]
MLTTVPPPTDRPFLLSVTGTNGKTSVTTFTHQILAGCGWPVASYTSFGVISPDRTVTPVEIERTPEFLPDMIAGEHAKGATAMALESFSGALAVGLYQRVAVDTAICTGIESDHLDFHKTFENYRDAKLRLFRQALRPEGIAIVPAEAPQADTVVAAARQRGIRTWILGPDHEISLRDPAVRGDRTTGRLAIEGHDLGPVTFPFPDRIAVTNALLALAAVIAVGADVDAAVAAVAGLTPPEGRLQLVSQARGITVIADSAHNPGAVRTALLACRDRRPARIIVVFGAGGERDRQKRPEMGRVAAELADLVVLTDDNPRREHPGRIRAEIRPGCPAAIEVPRRVDAIRAALHMARAGDLVLLAGKGDETTQSIAGVDHPHDDREVARRVLAEL